MAQQWAALDPENQEAWTVWQRVARRFVFDFHLGAIVLAPELATRTPEAQADLLARLGLIYDRVMPSPDPKGHAHGT